MAKVPDDKNLQTSKVKDKVVITGGFYPGNTYLYPNFDGPTSRPLQSTEVLDLATRKIEYAGNMNTARYGFHLVTIITDNVHKIFALGGFDGSYTFDSVEEFDPEEYTWRRVKATIATTRSYYGAMMLSIAHHIQMDMGGMETKCFHELN